MMILVFKRQFALNPMEVWTDPAMVHSTPQLSSMLLFIIS